MNTNEINIRNVARWEIFLKQLEIQKRRYKFISFPALLYRAILFSSSS